MLVTFASATATFFPDPPAEALAATLFRVSNRTCMDWIGSTTFPSYRRRVGVSSMAEKMDRSEYRDMHSSYQITETHWLGHLWRISCFPVAMQSLHAEMSRSLQQKKSP